MNEIIISREKVGLGYNNAAVYIRKAINKALEAEGIQNNCIVSVMLTDDDGIRTMNNEFRRIDAPTDVLSFPMNELQPGAFDASACEFDPETGAILLGDMMIDLERCAQQGEEFGHGFEREVMYLSVHSLLHLLGYDHMDEGEQKLQMRSREKAIMGDE